MVFDGLYVRRRTAGKGVMIRSSLEILLRLERSLSLDDVEVPALAASVLKVSQLRPV